MGEDKGQVGITAYAGWGGLYEQYRTCSVYNSYTDLYLNMKGDVQLRSKELYCSTRISYKNCYKSVQIRIMYIVLMLSIL